MCAEISTKYPTTYLAYSPNESTETYLHELTPYKGLWVVICLLNGYQPKDPALKNSYLVYYVIFTYFISPNFCRKSVTFKKIH